MLDVRRGGGVNGDPGLELPDYPQLPIVDGRLDLAELEAWQMELARRSIELGSALLLIHAGAAPGEDHEVVLARMGEFEALRRADMAWVFGWVMGRTEELRHAAWSTVRGADHGSFHLGLEAGREEHRRSQRSATAGLGRR